MTTDRKDPYATFTCSSDLLTIKLNELVRSGYYVDQIIRSVIDNNANVPFIQPYARIYFTIIGKLRVV